MKDRTQVMHTPIKKRLRELLDHLNHGLVERDSTLKAALLAALAGENLLIVGPPGTAKSLIARKVAKCLPRDDDAEQVAGYFEYLLTKFSTPEEIFGPLSITELKADRFKRNTAGYLPSVRVAFLDEIFKASSSILNALLTILNERLYHNGAEVQKVPLQVLIAASNELPTGQEELNALYDRFLVRSFVDYVSEDNLPRLLDKPGRAPTITPLSITELTAIQQAAEAITLPADIVSAIQQIWAEHKKIFQEDRRESLSDRRLRKVVGLLCISAATNGRPTVDLSDLLLLKDCLWNHPDNALQVRELVMKVLRTFNRPVPLSESESRFIQKGSTLHKGTTTQKAISTTDAVIKGYTGCGTTHDPILIKNLHDLVGLERPEIGQAGYCFRQTVDIDCSELTTWLNINFQGTYDGGGHSISDRGKRKVELFASMQRECEINGLRLNGLGLAKSAEKSKIFDCTSDVQLLTTASSCDISYCQSGDALILGRIESSTISRCRSKHVLITHSASGCRIQDCEILIAGMLKSELTTFNDKWNISSCIGGVAVSLTDGTIVERCFVTGITPTKQDKRYVFNGIAGHGTSSTIRQCAFGQFKPKNIVSRRIAPIGDATLFLENNVALDCHQGESDPNGPDGKSLSAALFTQHYFQHTLNWDFENVWQWNDVENQPELRTVGSDAAKDLQLHDASSETSDLLTQQLGANLWL